MLRESYSRLTHVGNGFKAAPVDGTRPMPGNRLAMLNSAITLMLPKTVSRIEIVEFDHQSISRYFGDDGCRGNALAESITLWNSS